MIISEYEKNANGDELGVFFICFKERIAIENFFEVFRGIYPTAPVYLSSDGGHDYKYLEEKYDNIMCVLDEEKTVGVTAHIEKMIKSGDYDIVNLFMASIEYLKRVKLAFDYCKTDYMLLAEPDVLVRGKMTMPTVDCVGPKPNPMPRHIQQYIIDNGGINNVAWGASAGIIKRESFMKIYNNIINNQHKMLQYLYMDPRMACYDYLFCFLLSIHGLRYDPNPELTECGRNPDWKLSRHPLLHQYMEKYSKDGDNYNKHFDHDAESVKPWC